MVDISRRETPASFIRVTQAAWTEALLMIRFLISFSVMTISLLISVSSAHAITNSGKWAVFRIRGLLIPVLMRPVLSITQAASSSASRSIRPDPQIPRGLIPLMVEYVGSRDAG